VTGPLLRVARHFERTITEGACARHYPVRSRKDRNRIETRALVTTLFLATTFLIIAILLY